MSNEELFDNLIKNALDFLSRAIREFEDDPKFSIIHFYNAIELFLKARLLREHWSLVVSKDPDRKRFEAGDFHSVSFEAACDRLRKVVQSPIGDQTIKNFDAVRKHRNKMVHFFHEADGTTEDAIKQIAIEQLKAWAGLNQLLTSQWVPIFDEHANRFIGIEKSLKRHREYLRAKYDELLPLIEAEKASGLTYTVCGSCQFEAARAEEIVGNLNEAVCRVCGWCGEANTGDMEGSNWEGCTVCDGHAGHLASKDD